MVRVGILWSELGVKLRKLILVKLGGVGAKTPPLKRGLEP